MSKDHCFSHTGIAKQAELKKKVECFASLPGVTCNQCFTDCLYMNALFWF